MDYWYRTNSSRGPQLVLVEPEGTLLLGSSAVAAECLQEALEDVFGVELEESASENFRGGGTDVQKAYSVLRQAGVSGEGVEHLKPAWTAYAADLYRLRAGEDPVPQMVAAGARDFLDACLSAGYHLGVVSLELEPIARLKLERAGLQLADAPGAFANDVAYHTGLVPLARLRAGESAGGNAWPRERTVLVGEGSGAICRGHSDPCAVALLRSRHERRQTGNAESVAHDFEELLGQLARKEPALGSLQHLHGATEALS